MVDFLTLPPLLLIQRMLVSTNPTPHLGYHRPPLQALSYMTQAFSLNREKISIRWDIFHVEWRWVSEPMWPISSEWKLISLGPVPAFSIRGSAGWGPVGWNGVGNPEIFLLCEDLKRRSHADQLTHGMAWKQRSVTTVLTGCSRRDCVGLELEVWRISRNAGKQGDSRLQTLRVMKDGVLTGSLFPKGIKEESPGSQRRLNFL